MHTELFSLSKLFTENLFRIPDYQRGYAWTDRQLKDFWTDLILLAPGRDHYTGVLTLEDVESDTYRRWTDDLWIIQSKRFRPYYVVDGQQRLTTSLILLQAITERIGPSGELNYSSTEDIRRKFIFESKDKGVSRSYVFGYERDNPSYEFLKTRIFLEASDNHSLDEETIYTSNLLAAKGFMVDQIKSMSVGEIEDVFTKLTQRFLYNIYTISKEIDVFVAFETMNNRGKPLSHLELLKNRLIYLSTRLHTDEAERDKIRSVINEAWKTAYHYLGRNKHNPLSDDDFLRLHFTLYVGPQLTRDSENEDEGEDEDEDEDEDVYQIRRYTRDDSYKDYLLDELFTSANIDSLVESSVVSRLSVRYLYDYAHDLKRAVQLYYEAYNPQDGLFTDSERIWLTRMNRLGWGELLPLTVVAAEVCCDSLHRPEFSNFLEVLERFRFVDALDVYTPDVTDLDTLALALRLKTRVLSLADVTQRMTSHLESVLGNANLQMHFAEQARRWGYYHWNQLRYFLFEYEQHLKARARATRDKLNWDEFRREDYRQDFRTVEHIYPQHATNSYWKSRFARLSARQRGILRNSLGNLLPLSAAKNSALGNRPFPEKKAGTSGTKGYAYGCYSEIDVSQGEDWTPQCILRRGIAMLEFMEARWNLSIGDRDAKVQALDLQFL
ncbi:DUF262 domain-containing HNH endonuclease family protein [Sorangium sp. So ce726]|uniref:DUF262 domain-containing protein n=1 Tax=Sorangium sp. So ce726 TaxID=3133319 RepID=UPI003F5D6A3E